MKRFAFFAVAALLAGCAAGHKDSPYYAECAHEAQLPDNPWMIGTVSRGMFDICIQRKEAEAKR